MKMRNLVRAFQNVDVRHWSKRMRINVLPDTNFRSKERTTGFHSQLFYKFPLPIPFSNTQHVVLFMFWRNSGLKGKNLKSYRWNIVLYCHLDNTQLDPRWWRSLSRSCIVTMGSLPMLSQRTWARWASAEWLANWNIFQNRYIFISGVSAVEAECESYGQRIGYIARIVWTC